MQTIPVFRRDVPLTALMMFACCKTAIAQPPSPNHNNELTHPFNEQTIYWPTEDGFKLEREAARVTERGYFYAANRFTFVEYGGTHIDAPRPTSGKEGKRSIGRRLSGSLGRPRVSTYRGSVQPIVIVR